MTPDSPSRLSEIETAWDLLQEAQAAAPDTARKARNRLHVRYQKAVFSYLCGCLRDEHAAQDLAQDFWVKFLQGAFRHADPQTGSFRQYVKAALSHMATRYITRIRRSAGELLTDPPDQTPSFEEDSEAFTEKWRQAVLNDAWDRLGADGDAGRGQYHALKLKAEFPQRPDHELALLMSERAGLVLSHDAFRKLLQRARTRFAETVYQVVAESVRNPTPDRVAEELEAVGLLRYCRTTVAERTRST